MILVCGSVRDAVTELVCARLEAMRCPYRLLELGWFPERYAIRCAWDGPNPTGEIEGPDWRLGLSEIEGVFVRFSAPEPDAGAAMPAGRLREAALVEHHASLMALWENLPCPVANRIAGSLSNHSKPYQLLLIRRTRLRIPRTLVTSSPADARAFHDECGGRVIFKSLSGVRSVVRLMGAGDFDRLDALRDCPAQFQEHVPGTDVRVHTVDGEVFATRIASAAVDYRFAEREGAAALLEPTTVPAWVAEACLALARAMGLVIAGIDLKETPEGDWYCFEVNPCPAFVYYERRTGQPISAALVAALRDGRSRTETASRAAAQETANEVACGLVTP
jgi:glutathione synthase/RimK-type ligase-like ATP-grasp enzyme